MADGRFWYRDNGPDGVTFVVVDPAKGMKGPAFDQTKLAAALTAATNGTMRADAHHLVISEITFSDGDKTVVVGNGSRGSTDPESIRRSARSRRSSIPRIA